MDPEFDILLIISVIYFYEVLAISKEFKTRISIPMKFLRIVRLRCTKTVYSLNKKKNSSEMIKNPQKFYD